MVSTRRTATKDSGNDPAIEAGHALRKKPIRKATAKAEPVITRATRTRKPQHVPESEPALEQEIDREEVIPPASSSQPAVRKATVKPREAKASAIIPPPSKREPTVPPRGAFSTRAISSRPKKANILVEEITGNSAPVPTPSPPIRITRQTRGKAAKSTPLSPKKVSQVSKGKTCDSKPAGKQDDKTKSRGEMVKSRSATRVRAVSDENINPEALQQGDDDMVDVSTVPMDHGKNLLPKLGPIRDDAVLRSESSMSSRPTTPAQSPALSLHSQDDCETEPEVGEDLNDDMMLDALPREQKQLDDSDDELAGPKTPMRRSSPGAHTRYLASVQRTIRKLDDRVSVHRLSRNLNGTPKTLSLATTFDEPISAVRETTVSPLNKEVSNPQKDSLCRAPEVAVDATMEDSGEPSKKGQITKTTWTDHGNSPRADDSLLLDTPYRTRRVSSIICSPSEGELTRDFENHNLSNGDNDNEHDGLPTNPDTETEHDDDSGHLHTRILDFDQDDGHVSDASACDSENTVLMINVVDEDLPEKTEIDQVLVDSEPGISDAPETLIWENIREDVTIPINFDKHFSSVRNSARMDQGNYLSEVMNLTPALGVADGRAGSDIVMSSPVDSYSRFGHTRRSLSGRDRRTTLDTFNEFVDVDALDRPTGLDHNNGCAQSSTELEALVSLSKAGYVQAAAEVELPQFESSHDQPFIVESELPHYALPTLAFHARRKSLPATNIQTPLRFGTRPHTSDGSSVPRPVTTDRQAWWARAASAHATPIRRQSAMVIASIAQNKTPSRQSLAFMGHEISPARRASSRPWSSRNQVHDKHANTVAVSSRFRTPVSTPAKRPSTSQKLATEAETPRTLSLRPRQSKTLEAQNIAGRCQSSKKSLDVDAPIEEATTPLASPGERAPWLQSRRKLRDPAKSVLATRYRTPVHSPPKRPATAVKPATSRKVTFSSKTPMKTPLKAPGMTPGQVPMTPHPAAPLRDVVALVEVFTLEGASASAPFITLLQRLGAKAQKTWSERITHVVFKDGSPRTLQKLRLHNQEVAQTGLGHTVHCVNSRWVSDCDDAGTRMPEADEAYAVDPTILPRGGSRRRKSMEPYALVNIGGNVVRDRKSSLGHHSLSLARSPLKSAVATPSHKALADSDAPMTPLDGSVGPDDQENTDLDLDDHTLSSPATPAWLHPEQLVQQTAPLHRVRKLDMKGTHPAKKRRRTFWVDGA